MSTKASFCQYALESKGNVKIFKSTVAQTLLTFIDGDVHDVRSWRQISRSNILKSVL